MTGVDDELLVAADGDLAGGRGLGPVGEAGGLGGGRDAEEAVAAHRVDAARKVALKQWQVTLTAITKAVAQIGPECEHEGPPGRALVEWIVPAPARFRLDELALTTKPGPLEGQLLQ